MELQPLRCWGVIRRLAGPCEAISSPQPTLSAERAKSGHRLSAQTRCPCPCAQPAQWPGRPVHLSGHTLPLLHPQGSAGTSATRAQLGEGHQRARTKTPPKTSTGAWPRVRALLPNAPLKGEGNERHGRCLTTTRRQAPFLPAPRRLQPPAADPPPRLSGRRPPSQHGLSALGAGHSPHSCPAPLAPHTATARGRSASPPATNTFPTPPCGALHRGPRSHFTAGRQPCPGTETHASGAGPGRAAVGRGRPASPSPWRWRSQRRFRTAPTWQRRQQGAGRGHVRQRARPPVKHARAGRGRGGSGSERRGGGAFSARSRDRRGGGGACARARPEAVTGPYRPPPPARPSRGAAASGPWGAEPPGVKTLPAGSGRLPGARRPPVVARPCYASDAAGYCPSGRRSRSSASSGAAGPAERRWGPCCDRRRALLEDSFPHGGSFCFPSESGGGFELVTPRWPPAAPNGSPAPPPSLLRLLPGALSADGQTGTVLFVTDLLWPTAIRTFKRFAAPTEKCRITSVWSINV